MKNKNITEWFLVIVGVAFSIYAGMSTPIFSKLFDAFYNYYPTWLFKKLVGDNFVSVIIFHVLGIALIVIGGLKILLKQRKKSR